MPAPRGPWRAWRRLSRRGVACGARRVSLWRALLAWALVLLALRAARRAPLRRARAPAAHFWRGRHLVFCVSPGRAGSKFLRNVLDAAERVVARHEPEPRMTGAHLQRVILRGHRRRTFDQRAALKLPAIRAALEGTAPAVAYAETSHMFVKTFADVVLHSLAHTANISVVILHRPLRDSVWSQLRLGWFSPAHSGKNVWYYDVNDVHPSERQLSYSPNSSHPIDSLIAYNADVLQRAMQLKNHIHSRHRAGQWPNVHVVETSLNSLSRNPNAVPNFLSSLGLKPDPRRLAQLKTLDINARDVKKDKFVTSATIHDVDARIHYMLNKLPLPRQAIQPSD